MADDMKLEMRTLVGQNLLGYMPLNADEYPGDWDNAIALFIGEAHSHTMYVLRTENEDYSSFSDWYLDRAAVVLTRDDRYKAIGEKIISVVHLDDPQENSSWIIEIKTKTKTIRLGVDWSDSYYPSSIWDEI